MCALSSIECVPLIVVGMCALSSIECVPYSLSLLSFRYCRFVIVLLSSKGTHSMLSTREYILLLLSLGLAYAITLSFLLSFFLETLVS